MSSIEMRVITLDRLAEAKKIALAAEIPRTHTLLLRLRLVRDHGWDRDEAKLAADGLGLLWDIL